MCYRLCRYLPKAFTNLQLELYNKSEYVKYILMKPDDTPTNYSQIVNNWLENNKGTYYNDFPNDNKSINVSSLAYWELVKEYNKVTLAVGAKTKVHVVDLAGSLPKNSAYFIDAIHFSEEGAKVVAEIIAEDISGYIENSSDLP